MEGQEYPNMFLEDIAALWKDNIDGETSFKYLYESIHFDSGSAVPRGSNSASCVCFLRLRRDAKRATSAL